MIKKVLITCAALITVATASFAQDVNPFVGRWALDVPGLPAAWLGVTNDKGYLDAEILWGWGSVVPVDGVGMIEGNQGEGLLLSRLKVQEIRDKQGKVVDKNVFSTPIMFRVENGELQGMMFDYDPGSKKMDQVEISGTKMADLPPAPDLSKVKFGEPIQLFNGKDLTGWKLLNPNDKNGWSVKDSVLVNNPVQQPGKHESYGNLRTEQEFEDFNLAVEFSVPKGGNSGIYLRGVYEVQVSDTMGRPLDPHNMGGIYSRITPSTSAEKPAGEWQTFDITLCDQHVTVILNGTTIIDNQPVLGPTGGALWSDVTKPGPLYLQGDHTGVSYRSVVIKPIVK